MKLYHKLILAILAISVFSVLTIAVFTYKIAYKKEVDISVRAVHDLVESVAPLATSAIENNDQDKLNEILQGLSINTVVSSATIHSAAYHKSSSPIEPNVLPVINKDLYSSKDKLQKIGCIHIVPCPDGIGERANSLASFVVKYLVIFNLFFLGFVIIIVSRYFARPVMGIIEQLKKINQLSLKKGTYLNKSGWIENSEFGELIDQFNDQIRQNRQALMASEQQINYDNLTRCKSRLYTEKSIKNYISTETSFCFAILDLDNFKDINDTYGHKIGDLVLITISQRLRNAVKTGDIVCRWGGDEFIIVLLNLAPKDAGHVLKRIYKATCEPIKIAGESEIHVYSSTGYANYPIHSTNAEELFHIADTALYKAKRAGKHTIEMPNKPKDVIEEES